MKKLSFKSQIRRGLLMSLLIAAVCGALALCATSCKAWRTITTSATYVQQSDSAKTSTTISTKTVEEYQGVKKYR